jgi:hypothetical protein
MMFLAITSRSLNKLVDVSANLVDSALSASNSERLFESSAVKIGSPWSQLAVLLLKMNIFFFVHT